MCCNLTSTKGVVGSEYPSSALIELLSEDPERELLDDRGSVSRESLRAIERGPRAAR